MVNKSEGGDDIHLELTFEKNELSKLGPTVELSTSLTWEECNRHHWGFDRAIVPVDTPTPP